MKYQIVTVKILCDDVSEAYELLAETYPFAEWDFFKDDGFWYIVGQEAWEVESPADFRLYEDDVEETIAKVLVCEYMVYTIYRGFNNG